MLIEKMIFNAIAFPLFVLMLLKMFKKNDTPYVICVILQAIGIVINFIEIIFKIKLILVIKILIYILSIILPLIIFILEKRKINILEAYAILMAKILGAIGKDKEAKNILINLVTKEPNSYIGHKTLAAIYEKEGGMRKAIDEYVKVIDLNNKDYESYFTIANLLNELGQKYESSIMLENLLRIKPEYYEAAMLLGDIYCQQEKFKEAAGLYTDLLKYRPLDYDVYYSLGMVYTLLNDFSNAKMCYEKAAEINSMLWKAKYNLAQISLIYKDLEEAEKYFEESFDDEELQADAYFELSKIHMIKGDKDIAIKYANLAIELDPRISSKVDKEPLFIPIRLKIASPKNTIENIEAEQEKKVTMSELEVKVKEHLEQTIEITKHLGYNDIEFIIKKQQSEKEENIENQREREE